MEPEKRTDNSDSEYFVMAPPPVGDPKEATASQSQHGDYVNLETLNKAKVQQPPTTPKTQGTYAYPPVPVPVPYNKKSVIVYQPTHEERGTKNETVPLLSGVEGLAKLDQFVVKRKVESVGKGKTKVIYKVKDSWMRDQYTAEGDLNSFADNFCGTLNSSEIRISDSNGREVIHLSIPSSCGSCMLPCCLPKMNVFAPPGVKAGSVEQDWGLSTPKFSVKNADGVIILKIKGSFCRESLTESVKFQVMTRDGKTQAGKTMMTDAENFGISFPITLTSEMKAVMLGACFFINSMFFENLEEYEN